MEPRVPSTYARALQRRFARETPSVLLEGTGVTQADIDAGAEVPLSALVRFAANLTRLRGPDWTVDAAPLLAAPAHGALEVGIRSAATAADALAVMARFAPVRAPYIETELRRSPHALRLVIAKALDIEPIVWQALCEGVALSAIALLAPIFEEAVADLTVAFPWAPPVHAERLGARLVCRVRYNTPEFLIQAPAELCRRPSPFSESDLHRRALEDLETALRRMGGGDLVVEVERLAAAALPLRLVEAEAARRLGLSRRTLVRRLAERGTAYRDLVDRVLRDKAQAMRTGRRLTRDEMAAELGYAEPTSFSRACRRWFKE